MSILESDSTTDPNPQLGMAEDSPVDPTEIEAPEDDLTEETTVELVTEPPTRSLRTNDGQTVTEDLIYTGWVAAPVKSRRLLEDYGIDLRSAWFCTETKRWESCLFSVQVADLLEQLSTENQFPFAFEATPSQAEVLWWKARERGAPERPEVALVAFCTPGNPEGLEDPEGHLRSRKGNALVAK
jgi:hypothetical protein